MIVFKSEFAKQIDWLRSDLHQLKMDYWDVRHRHDRLLKHLGLDEYQPDCQPVLRKKGGPEEP